MRVDEAVDFTNEAVDFTYGSMDFTNEAATLGSIKWVY